MQGQCARDMRSVTEKQVEMVTQSAFIFSWYHFHQFPATDICDILYNSRCVRSMKHEQRVTDCTIPPIMLFANSPSHYPTSTPKANSAFHPSGVGK